MTNKRPRSPCSSIHYPIPAPSTSSSSRSQPRVPQYPPGGYHSAQNTRPGSGAGTGTGMGMGGDVGMGIGTGMAMNLDPALKSLSASSGIPGGIGGGGGGRSLPSFPTTNPIFPLPSSNSRPTPIKNHSTLQSASPGEMDIDIDAEEIEGEAEGDAEAEGDGAEGEGGEGDGNGDGGSGSGAGGGVRKKQRRAPLACIKCITPPGLGPDQPCTSCAKVKVECVFPEKVVKAECRPEYVIALKQRIERLEDALRKYNPSEPVLAERITEKCEIGSFLPTHANTSTDANLNPKVGAGSMSGTSYSGGGGYGTGLGSAVGAGGAGSVNLPGKEMRRSLSTALPQAGNKDLSNPYVPSSTGSNTLSPNPATHPSPSASTSTHSHHPRPTSHNPLNPAPNPASPSSSAAHAQITESASGSKKEEIAAGVALLSLNPSGEGNYVGGSNGFSWAKIILGILDQSPDRSQPESQADRRLPRSERPPIPTAEMTSTLLDAFYMHVQARYSFLDYVKLKGWLQRREELLGAEVHRLSGEDRIASFFLWMTYAVGAKLVAYTAHADKTGAEAYYKAALEHVDVILQCHDIRTIQGLLMLAIYSFRSVEGSSIWHLVGFSMRISIELGLHRKQPKTARIDPYQEQLRRRVWWSTYGLDRFISLALGRPIHTSDLDIDQLLPIDMPCDSMEVPLEDDRDSEDPFKPDIHYDENKPLTSMTSYIHLVKALRLESEIHSAVYRADLEKRDSEDIQVDVSRILKRLEVWRDHIPIRPTGAQHRHIPCGSKDWFMMRYEDCRLLLLRPLTVKAEIGHSLLPTLAQSAATLSEIHRRLLSTRPMLFSLLALHSIYLSGLTLLHALRIDPGILPFSTSQRAIRACSNSLFLYAQNWQAAVPFRDSFEDLAGACLEACEKSFASAESANKSEAEAALAEIQPVNYAPARNDAQSWETQVADMASWMLNSNQQTDFLNLIASLGFAQEDLVTPAQPPPAIQEQLFMSRAPMAPMRLPNNFPNQQPTQQPARAQPTSSEVPRPYPNTEVQPNDVDSLSQWLNANSAEGQADGGLNFINWNAYAI